MRTVAAAFTAVVGLFFIGVAVAALVRDGWAAIPTAAFIAFFGAVNLRVASYMLQPETDDPEKLS